MASTFMRPAVAPVPTAAAQADGQPHGSPVDAHHVGDLPALQANSSGAVDQKFMLAVGLIVAAGPASLLNRAVIVHAQTDDYTTQPTGNSGARSACGVIAAL